MDSALSDNRQTGAVLNLARLSRTMAILMRSGVHLLNTVSIANRWYRIPPSKIPFGALWGTAPGAAVFCSGQQQIHSDFDAADDCRG